MLGERPLPPAKRAWVLEGMVPGSARLLMEGRMVSERYGVEVGMGDLRVDAIDYQLGA